MNIIAAIFGYLVFFFIGIVALAIFVQSSKELWDEVGKEATQDLMVKIKELTVKALDFNVSLLGTMRMKMWKMRNRLSRQM